MINTIIIMIVIIILWSSYASYLIMIMMIIIPRLEQEDRLVRSNGETSTDYPSLKIVQRKDYWWDIGIENIAIVNIVIIVARYKTSPQMTRRAITKLSSLRWSKTIMRIHWIFSWLFVSSVRSSSGYHGLIEIRASNPLFQIFQILQIRKWKWKDPTCAIFLKSMGFKDIEYDIPVYQM